VKDTWKLPLLFERRYETSIARIVRQLLARAPGGDDPAALVQFFASPSTQAMLQAAAEEAARNMVTGLAVANARTWREAASKAMKGRPIYNLLQNEMQGAVGVRVRQLVSDNARLITGIPGTLAEHATAHAMKEAQAGRRASEVAADLRKQLPGLAASRIQLIARTEVSKSSTALTQARAESIGLEWAMWCTSEDARVRVSHRKMDTTLFRWFDLPSPERLAREPNAPPPYAPGCIWNCRCFAAPVLRLDQISFPHKVFMAGRIQNMTRAAFASIAGAEVRTA
jgi:SPP1 gp7 family putative phage head morphogenesis protein